MTTLSQSAVPAPSVAVRAADGVARAVTIVLPGGKADSFDPTDARQLTGLRMLPFARSLARRGAPHGVEVWTLRYRYRGWNGAQMSPVQDARWALEEVRRRHGDVPVMLVGHSMGGRTAMRVAGDDSVVGVVGLAPWLTDTEPVAQLRDRSVLVAHGNLDAVTSPRASRAFVRRLDGVARGVAYVTVRGEMHAMVFRPSTWHRLATAFTLDVLGLAPLPGRVRRALERGYV